MYSRFDRSFDKNRARSKIDKQFQDYKEEEIERLRGSRKARSEGEQRGERR